MPFAKILDSSERYFGVDDRIEQSFDIFRLDAFNRFFLGD